MSVLDLILLSMLLPFVAMAGKFGFNKAPNVRDGFTLVCAIGTFITVLSIYQKIGNLSTARFELFEVFPGIELAFHIEPLGLMFALIASGLWIVTHLYAIGYMRGAGEEHHNRFFACFSLAIGAVMGVAFSANLFTLFLFYEILTFSTYPLVAHKGNQAARDGARVYLAILVTTSIAFLLAGILWVFALTGNVNFQKGGVLSGIVDGWMAPVLLALFAFGIGKAALMPFHKWLPAAMVAPTPVSALLHAVAVVKAGVFAMLKVGIYIFGLDFLAETSASVWLIYLAGFSIIAASVVAMYQDNLKRRLAYSTVSQLSYITMAMALATELAAIGGGMHIAMHAMGKITLFMCAGAIYVVLHKTEISDMKGAGRMMPITFVAFAIGALSIIGLPPLGGSWPKFLIMAGAADAGQLIAIGVLALSSILNVAYLLPIVGRGFYSGGTNTAMAENRSNLLVWLPPAICALGCVILFFYAGGIQAHLEPIVR